MQRFANIDLALDPRSAPVCKSSRSDRSSRTRLSSPPGQAERPVVERTSGECQGGNTADAIVYVDTRSYSFVACHDETTAGDLRRCLACSWRPSQEQVLARRHPRAPRAGVHQHDLVVVDGCILLRAGKAICTRALLSHWQPLMLSQGASRTPHNTHGRSAALSIFTRIFGTPGQHTPSGYPTRRGHPPRTKTAARARCC